MNPDLERLMELESADREIARLRKEVASLPGRVAVIEQKLARSKAQLESARTRIKDGEGLKRKQEGEIQAQQQKIGKYREQSLDVKTNEQYKALMHEIGFAEQSIRAAEDNILELMLEAESQEKLVRAAEAELKQETAEIEKEKAEARAVTAKDEKELAEWNGKRDALRAAIDADVLRHYDRVFKLRGSAVAQVRDQKCLACQVVLRPQTYNEIRSNESVAMCDSCQRILIYTGEPLPVPAPPAAALTTPVEEEASAEHSEVPATH